MTTGTVLVLALGLACAPVPVDNLQGDLVLAGGGCCMEMQGGSWRKVHRDFQRCVNDNQEKDGDDNLMERKGQVWWNPAC